MATDPAFVVSVLGMATIGQTGEELSIAVRAADVFRWPCTGTIDACGNARRRLDDEKLLELDQVMPIVAKVVDVDEFDVVASAEVEQLDLVFVVNARVADELGLDEIRVAERQAADLKFVQVIVPPAERCLDDLVQLTEMERPRHDQAPPDGRIDLPESDPHLHRSRQLEHESAVCRAAASWP